MVPVRREKNGKASCPQGMWKLESVEQRHETCIRSMVQAMRQAQTRSSHGWDDLGCINKPLDQDGRTSERTMWNSSCLKSK